MAQWGKTFKAVLGQNEILDYWDNGDFIIGISDLDKTKVRKHLSELLIILRKQIFTVPSEDTKNNKIHRFQVNFNVAIAEFLQDGETLNDLYNAFNTKFRSESNNSRLDLQS